jgi:Antitoxin VbhA
VCNALVNGIIEGWTPDRQSVLRPIDVAAGRIDADEYKQQVLNART